MAPQQGWPLSPQATQLASPPGPPAVWQAKPAEQAATSPDVGLGQHGWLAPPQATQLDGIVAVWQNVFGAVQRLFAQHAFPSPPQVPHTLAEQVEVMPGLHCNPAALHVAVPLPETGGIQHPPSRQKLPGQHGSSEPPQAVQTLGPALAWQNVLAAVQDELVQHASSVPPQVPQAPFEHVPESGLGQVLPLAVQTPPTQHPLFEHALPAQQS